MEPTTTHHTEGNADELQKLFGEHDIETVLIGGADINGVFRGKRIPAWRFLKNPQEAMHFADVMCVMDIADEIIPPHAHGDGWFPSWEAGFGDLEAKADLDTLHVLPWADRTAVVLCDYSDLEGRPLEVMPRNVLRRMVDKSGSMGFTPVMSPEFEFTVMAETPESLGAKNYCDPQPLAQRPVTYGVQLASSAEPLIAALRRGVEGLGIPIEASNAESGPGQFELNLTPTAGIAAGDHAFLFKHAIREIAMNHGYTASFMAKIAPGGFGSSLHVHQSLRDEGGTNVFYDADADDKLSTVARQYLAGMFTTMHEFTAVFAPTINSYKRFEPYAAVGCTRTWSIQSKAVGIRVVNDGPTGCRIEHRTPGADANPYLVLAAMLAGGLAGIENDLDPGKPYQGDSYRDSNVEWVPRNLVDAVKAFEQSEIANTYFGEETVKFFARTRHWEIEQFNNAVTDWELRRYLGAI